MIPNTKYPPRARLARGGQIPNTKSGFSLIEIMIAVFFVSVGLIGVLAFFNASLRSNFDAKNELVAAGLAQEGNELVRNLVEYKRLNPGPSDTWDTIADWFQNNCGKIDYRSLASRSCQSGSYVRFVGGQYQQWPSDPGTGMQRTLTINHRNNSNGNYLEINSTVTWDNGSRTTTANDIIYENNY